MRRFIVAVDRATPAQRNAVTTYLNGMGAYWHWLSDVWLWRTRADHTSGELRQGLIEILDPRSTGVRLFITEVELPSGRKSFAGFGPAKMYNWLDKHWKEEKEEK